MKLIYGSQAIKYWYPDFKRTPNDIDYISNEIHSKNTKEIEYYWIEEFSYLEKNKDSIYVDPDFLYTIKVSHAAWDINWTKTMKDIEFLQTKNVKLDKKFYQLLYSKWKIIHGNKKVKMNTENKDFFKKNIKRKYNHDWLHEEISFYNRPLHEKIRKNLNNPLCSQELWNKLSNDDKLKCALEELYVLTLERYVFVENPIPLRHSIIQTLKQMITSSTSGWFNLFLIENFTKLRTYPLNHINEKIKKIEEIK